MLSGYCNGYEPSLIPSPPSRPRYTAGQMEWRRYIERFQVKIQDSAMSQIGVVVYPEPERPESSNALAHDTRKRRARIVLTHDESLLV